MKVGKSKRIQSQVTRTDWDAEGQESKKGRNDELGKCVAWSARKTRKGGEELGQGAARINSGSENRMKREKKVKGKSRGRRNHGGQKSRVSKKHTAIEERDWGKDESHSAKR